MIPFPRVPLVVLRHRGLLIATARRYPHARLIDRSAALPILWTASCRHQAGDWLVHGGLWLHDPTPTDGLPQQLRVAHPAPAAAIRFSSFHLWT